MKIFRRNKSDNSATDKALSLTRNSLLSRFNDLFGSNSIEGDFWDSLEEILISADMGAKTSLEIIENIQLKKLDNIQLIYGSLREELISRLLIFNSDESQIDDLSYKPWVILIVGVNGSGKTTALGRLAYKYQLEGKKVIAAAADTFRAAAIDQLQDWAEKLDFDLVAHQHGSDPAAVVFDALDASIARKHDIVLIDTAGRLQNSNNLMAELTKLRNVVKRKIQRDPDEVFLVLDASIGQNGFVQASAFAEAVDVSGVILTKLDGSSRGGIVFSIVKEFGLPVRFVGVGQSAEDLVPFNAEIFVDALLGDININADV